MRPDDDHTEDQFHWHMAELDKVRRLWTAGQIGTAEKRRLIAAENDHYYNGPHKSLATGEDVTRSPKAYDQMASLITDATGKTPEQVRMALDARRTAYLEAADAPTAADAKRLITEGTAAYQSLLKA